LGNTFSCKNHTDAIVPKLSSACFAVRTVKPFLSQESLRMVYCSYFHSIMTYGLVFWGNSYHSNTVLKLQKREVLESCWELEIESHAENISGELKILPLQSRYIYIYTYSYHLWLILDSILKSILMYIILKLGINLTCITHSLICQFTRRVHITLGLRYSTDYLFQ
jgi:hypothetical protein